MAIDLASQERVDKARSLFDHKDWAELWRHKNTCRKSWKQLGFNAKEINSIKFYKPSWM